MLQRIIPKEKVPQLKGKIVDKVVFYGTMVVLVIAIAKWIIGLF